MRPCVAIARFANICLVIAVCAPISVADEIRPRDDSEPGKNRASLGTPRPYVRVADGAATTATESIITLPTPKNGTKKCENNFGEKADCPPALMNPVDKSSYPTAKLTGLLQIDAAFFHQSPTNEATLGNVADGLGFRRVRPGIIGNVTKNISYILELDFSNTIPLFVDMWVNFEKVPYAGNVRIGRWRQPFGMSELTGIREIPFMERELGFTFAPFRQTGIGVFDHTESEHMTWALSAYRFNSDFFGNVVGDIGGYGMAGRVTWLPYRADDGALVHLGFGYSFNDPARNLIRYFNTPEVAVAESVAFITTPIFLTPFFVDTGFIPTRNINLVNIEWAAALGKLILQSEVRWAVIDQIAAGNVSLPAAYAMFRYMLTDDVVPYNGKTGTFGRVKPRDPIGWGRGGWGAWEIAGRWSYIDLNGTTGNGPGRLMHNLTIGLNWYLNDRVRYELNYIHSFLKDPVLGWSDVDIVALRTQIDF